LLAVGRRGGRGFVARETRDRIVDHLRPAAIADRDRVGAAALAARRPERGAAIGAGRRRAFDILAILVGVADRADEDAVAFGFRQGGKAVLHVTGGGAGLIVGLLRRRALAGGEDEDNRDQEAAHRSTPSPVPPA